MIRANTARWHFPVGVMTWAGSMCMRIGAFCLSLHIGGRGKTSSVKGFDLLISLKESDELASFVRGGMPHSVSLLRRVQQTGDGQCHDAIENCCNGDAP